MNWLHPAIGLFAVGVLASSPVAAQQRANPFVQSSNSRASVEIVPNTVDPRPSATASLGLPSKISAPTIGPDGGRFLGPDASGFEAFVIQDVSQTVSVSRPARLPNASKTNVAGRHARTLDRWDEAPTQSTPVAPYLATRTSKSQKETARALLARAEVEFHSAAFASAEATAWRALDQAAQAIDSEHAESGREQPTAVRASQRLEAGRNAIRESQDFAGPYVTGGREAVVRIARSHRTAVIRQSLPPRRIAAATDYRATTTDNSSSLPTPTQAIDRYLDFARTELAWIAAESLEAAQAMDLLAAIRLGRNDSSQLPGPTAISLRRAAVQGQSGNADLVAKLGLHLADVGLIDEARWALSHSLRLQYQPTIAARLTQLNQLSRENAMQPTLAVSMQNHHSPEVPDVTQLSPQQFASISRSVLPTGNSGSAAPLVKSAAYRLPDTVQENPLQGPSYSDQGAVLERPATPANPPQRISSRLLPALKKWW